MSNYGFKIIGDHGFTILDDQYSNYILVNKGVATVGYSQSGEGYMTQITVPGIKQTSLFALSGPTLSLHVGTSFSDGVVTVYSKGTPGSSQIEWWCYDLPTGPSSENWGVRIFRDDGQIAYDSGHEPMSVLGNTTATAVSDRNHQEGIFVGSMGSDGRKLAVICSNPAVAVWSAPQSDTNQGSTPNHVYVAAHQQIGTGSVEFVNTRFAVYGAGQDTNRSRTGQYLVVDVSGL